MSKKVCILAKRRQGLVENAAQQRLLLTQIIETWRPKLLLADQTIAVISNIKQHPIQAAGASFGILTLMRSSRMLKWFRRGFLAWQVVRKVGAFYAK